MWGPALFQQHLPPNTHVRGWIAIHRCVMICRIPYNVAPVFFFFPVGCCCCYHLKPCRSAAPGGPIDSHSGSLPKLLLALSFIAYFPFSHCWAVRGERGKRRRVENGAQSSTSLLINLEKFFLRSIRKHTACVLTIRHKTEEKKTKHETPKKRGERHQRVLITRDEDPAGNATKGAFFLTGKWPKDPYVIQSIYTGGPERLPVYIHFSCSTRLLLDFFFKEETKLECRQYMPRNTEHFPVPQMFLVCIHRALKAGGKMTKL